MWGALLGLLQIWYKRRTTATPGIAARKPGGTYCAGARAGGDSDDALSRCTAEGATNLSKSYDRSHTGASASVVHSANCYAPFPSARFQGIPNELILVGPRLLCRCYIGTTWSSLVEPWFSQSGTRDDRILHHTDVFRAQRCRAMMAKTHCISDYAS